MDLFLLHCIILVWLSVGAASRWTDHPSDRFLAAGALLWSNLLSTSLLLSPFDQLGHSECFLTLSLGLAVLTALIAWRYPAPVEAGADPGTAHDGLQFTALLTLAPVALASVWAAAIYLPTDPASLGHLWPRTLQHISVGSILSLRPEASWHALEPLNSGLLQIWVLVCQPSLQTLNFINLFGWLASGVAVHRLARVAGGSANSALVASWCALMATPVLAQAATVGPVLCTGAALLAAASFTLDWVKRGRVASAAFAGLLAGLAAGSNLGALVLILALVSLGLAFKVVPRSNRGWIVAMPGLVLGLLPFGLTNLIVLAKQGINIWPVAWQQMTDGAAGLGPAVLVPLWQRPQPLLAPTEDTVGLGWAGLVSLAAALLSVVRCHRSAYPAALLGLLSLGWLGVCLLAGNSIGLGSGELVPAILLAAPCIANQLDRISLRPAAWSLLGIALASGSLWSAHLYLSHNAYRPLAPLLDLTLAGRQLSPLPPLLEHRLLEEAHISLPVNRDDHLLLTALRPARSGRTVVLNDKVGGTYHIISRPVDEGSGFPDGFDGCPRYALVPFPDKPTVGVEYLGRMQLGTLCRDFFGMPGDGSRRTPRPAGDSVLVTVCSTQSSTLPPELRLEVVGLNPEDHARLAAFSEDERGRRELLAIFTTRGIKSVPFPAALHRIWWQLAGTDDGRELAAVALDRTPAVSAPVSSLSAGPRPMSGMELVSAGDSPGVSCTGLQPAEGPFPQWKLPLIRWTRSDTVILRIPADPLTSALRFSFSARLYARRRSVLEIVCNGVPVQRVEFNDPVAWQEKHFELPARAGENLIELRDVPLPPEPDWAAYLERYPDVKRYVEMLRQPPYEGAREHYEHSGKAEGRIMTYVQPPHPAAGTYYYMFRSLRVEEIKP